MNPLVASAIVIFALYVLCVAVWLYATNNEHVNTKMRLKAQKLREIREIMQDDEEECPDWAEPEKWRESLR